MIPATSRFVGRTQIGRGGMGTVYKAQDTVLGRTVALKVMSGRFANQANADNAMQRFLRGARALHVLQHPYIVAIFDTLEFEDGPCLVMEYVEGPTLDRVLRKGPALPLTQKLRLVADVCEALDYAHGKGIMHRDLKPANIIVLPDGKPKIIDFDIAKLIDETTDRRSTLSRIVLVGTFSYMSPEQVMGKGLTGSTDIFSAGLILYELLAGKSAFTRFENARNRPVPKLDGLGVELPTALHGIFARATAKEPADRYPTAGEFARDLNACLPPQPAGDSAANMPHYIRPKLLARADEIFKRFFQS